MSLAAVAPRLDDFRRYVREVLADVDETEAIERITEAHSRHLGAAEARVRGLELENSTGAREARRQFEMLAQTQQMASAQIRNNAEMAATVIGQQRQLARLHHMAVSADDGKVNVVDLMAVLTEDVPPVMINPVVTAFCSDDRYRAGTFHSHDGAVMMTYAFIGWSMVNREPGQGGTIEPSFLVGDRVLARSTIEAEKRMRMQMPLLPSLTSI